MRVWIEPKSGSRLSNFYVRHPTVEVHKISRNIAVFFTLFCGSENFFCIKILTNLNNSLLRICWQIPGLFPSYGAITHFFKLFFFLPKSRFQILVFHFFMYLRDLFFNSDSIQHNKILIAQTLIVNEKKINSVSRARIFRKQKLVCRFFTQFEISNVNF